MNSMDQLRTILPEKPENQRIWVVRAASGRYLNNFLHDSMVAIGHIDGGIRPAERQTDYSPSKKEIQRLVESVPSESPRSRSTITSHVNQVKTFIHDMKIGDMVVTLNDSTLVFGRVIGKPYLDPSASVYEYLVGKRRKKVELPYLLRRGVMWGPKIRRDAVPYSVENSIRSHQAVFSIDRHWEYIYHLLYPFFLADNQLHFSLRIQSQKDLDNYAIAQLFALFTELEILAKSVVQAPSLTDSPENYDDIEREYIKTRPLEMKTKAEFMSPGSIWAHLPAEAGTIALIVIGIAVVFGGKGFGLDFPGIITPRMRERFLEHWLARKEAKGREKLIESVKPKIEKRATEVLTDESKDEK